MLEIDKETKGAWIVHHSRKIVTDISAPAEYSALDEAGKAAELLIRLGATNETNLTRDKVQAVAKAANLNPRTELPHYLNLLTQKRLIDSSSHEIQILGISTRSVLGHTADIFDASEPSPQEIAAIALGEISSNKPILLNHAQEYISDTFKIASVETNSFIQRAVEIGFVDKEGDDSSNILLFNGNLFKKDSVKKTSHILSSLSDEEQSKFREITDKLNSFGCCHSSICEKTLGIALFEKLKATGALEVNIVSNETGEHAFVTLPGSFHKFVNPLIDDSFDMAKALVSALSYGMHLRSPSVGRIFSVELLLNKLINGHTIGPATAIGADYRVLEVNRVVEVFQETNNMFSMKLLKKDVGQIALQVLKSGNGNAETISSPLSAPMTGYTTPETTREKTRKKQSKPSKRQTHDILNALREQRRI